jgi:hypothetical protein
VCLKAINPSLSKLQRGITQSIISTSWSGAILRACAAQARVTRIRYWRQRPLTMQPESRSPVL